MCLNMVLPPRVLGARANLKEKGERQKEQYNFLLSDLLGCEQAFIAVMD